MISMQLRRLYRTPAEVFREKLMEGYATLP